MLAHRTETIHGLDAEWDTISTGFGNSRTRKKSGKVALLQISYKIDELINVLLLQLPRASGTLPNRLLSFLKDSETMFVGVNVKNDVNLLGNDYGYPDLSSEVKVQELGMFARVRDVVEKGNCSLEHLVCRAGEQLDKSEDVRCSKWSRHELSEPQKGDTRHWM